MSDTKVPFEVEFEVRDYECDLQGIVNNANYQHYFEHARHIYLKSIGLDFAALHERGADAIVQRVEIDYRKPLRSGDRFAVQTSVATKGIMRFVFTQRILVLPSRVCAADGLITAAFMGTKGPLRPPSDVADALAAAEREGPEV